MFFLFDLSKDMHSIRSKLKTEENKIRVFSYNLLNLFLLYILAIIRSKSNDLLKGIPKYIN